MASGCPLYPGLRSRVTDAMTKKVTSWGTENQEPGSKQSPDEQWRCWEPARQPRALWLTARQLLPLPGPLPHLSPSPWHPVVTA